MAEPEDPLKGYRGAARDKLLSHSVRVWSDVRLVNAAGSVFEGVILPRSGTFDDLHVVLKLKNGYNVGIHVDRVTSIEELGYKEAVYKIPEKEFPTSPDLPEVTLLGTGGTIASRLDYRTGAVIPAFTPGELYGAVPELADICNLTTKKIFGVFSENMAWPEYVALAENIGSEIEAGADGIVIGHGTDTMGHTAAVLSFMVQDSPVPIVIVGSQRSSDRPSSDAALNLIHASVRRPSATSPRSRSACSDRHRTATACSTAAPVAAKCTLPIAAPSGPWATFHCASSPRRASTRSPTTTFVGTRRARSSSTPPTTTVSPSSTTTPG